MLLGLLAFVTACTPADPDADGDPTGPPPSGPTVTAITVAPGDLELAGVGGNGALSAVVVTSQGISTAVPVTWTSGAPAVATVQGTGQQATVTAVGVGTATITATAGTRSATATVRVTAAARTLTVTVTGAGRIVSAPAGIDCTAGATTGCTASFTDGTAVSLAALPGAGQLLAGWSGACGGAATCQVTMTEPRTVQATFSTVVLPVASVLVAPAVATIAPGSSATLTATPRDAAGQSIAGRTITWTSADPAVVTVSASGVVTGVGVGGPVAVTATVDGVSGSAQLTVRSPFITAVSVGTSGSLSCAVEANGDAFCWGRNDYGQRGNGSTGGAAVSKVTSSEPFTTIDAGYWHACATTRASEVFCWGYGNGGEIGDGTTTMRLLPTRVTGGLLAERAVAAEFRSCGLAASGTLSCWGFNPYSTLGIGTSAEKNPIPRTVIGGIRFREVVMSKSNTTQCGVDTDSHAWCWGSNTGGGLGDGTATWRTAPVRVLGGHSFASVSPGEQHTCGITTQGVAYCWGRQDAGALGNGIVSFASEYAPVPVSTTLRFMSIASGSSFACAVALDGVLYCWGANRYGALGDGTYTDRSTPAPALTSVRFASVVAGASNACAIAESGVVYCWGRNDAGSVSGSGSDPINVPVAIPRP